MKKYCIKPFNTIRLVNDANGEYQYQPCCHYRRADKFDTVDDYLNSEQLHNLQQHLLTKDYLPDECGHCSQYEESGHESTRQLFNKMIPIQKTTDITDIEIFPSNSCNLSCIMCQPRASTGVGLEHKKLGWIEKVIAVDNKSKILEDLRHLPNLKRLIIIGGEFFLAKSCIDIINFAIDKNLAIRFVTNATTISEKHLERLKLVNELVITVSIDALDSEYEFIRYPASWVTVEKNVDILRKQLSNAKVDVNCVVQLLNIQVIDKLINWCNKRLLPLTLVPVDGADWLSWQVLTNEEKEKVVDLVNNMHKHTAFTKQQKTSLNHFANNINDSVFDPLIREKSISRLSALSELRQIEIPIQIKHLMNL